MIDREVFRIKTTIENDENFKNIKNVEAFSEKIYKVYWNKKDIVYEIKKAGLWVYNNPKRKKKNWGRFLSNWLGR